jgi:hypothetical protein
MEVVIVVKNSNDLEPHIGLHIYEVKTKTGKTKKTFYVESTSPYNPDSYSLKHPPKAIYESKPLCGLVNYAYRYTVDLSVLGLDIDSDICIIKNSDIAKSNDGGPFYNIRIFGDVSGVDIFHNVTIDPQVNIIAQLKEILHTRLPAFNNELTYKIMRRCTLLVRFLGYQINEKFKDLLKVDCAVLNDAVNRLACEFGMTITRDIGQHPNSEILLNFLHFMLYIESPKLSCKDLLRENLQLEVQLELMKRNKELRDEIKLLSN